MIEIIMATCLIGPSKFKIEVRVVDKETVPLEHTRGTATQTWLVRDKKSGRLYKAAEDKCIIKKIVRVNV